MVKLANITEIIPVPEDVTVTVEANNDVTVKGNGGEIKRNFNHNNITVTKDDENVTIFVALTNKKDKIMKKYVCTPCGWVYDPAIGDPENGIEAGTAFENLPEDWVCPLCGADKEAFEEI